MVLQRRTLKKAHIDQHYGAKYIQNWRRMCVKYNKYSTCVMLDDKAAIPIGPVGTPVSATRRQRAVLQSGGSAIDCTDHDHVTQHLTPSVSIVMDAPSDPASFQWYGGQPEVTLKCAIFEPSNAFRHAAELSNRLKTGCKPFIFGIADGGPDHNTLHIQTQLSLIALFIRLDVDYLCFLRTPPNFSTLNPVERCMCVINIALQGVALSRDTIGEKEKLIKNLGSKVTWREAAKKHPNIDFKDLAIKSTKTARDLIEARITRLN